MSWGCAALLRLNMNAGLCPTLGISYKLYNFLYHKYKMWHSLCHSRFFLHLKIYTFLEVNFCLFCPVVIWTYFGVFLIVVLLGSDPPAHQVVPHSVGKSKVVIPLVCYISILDQGKVEMSVEVLLQICNVFNAGEASHGNLFLSIMVRQRFWHGGTSCSGSGLWRWKNVNSRTADTHHQAQTHSKRGTHRVSAGSRF